jgi:hypothetical protein
MVMLANQDLGNAERAPDGSPKENHGSKKGFGDRPEKQWIR